MLLIFQAEKFDGGNRRTRKGAFFIILMGILIFIILPSALFYYVEGNWTYLDCIYYTFVSLTTIGFGDFTTAQGEQERFGMWIFAYNGFTVVWLIFGLSFISISEVFYHFFIAGLQTLYRCCKKCIFSPA